MMENLLFVLALAGIVLGGYSLFAPSLRKRGWSLPLMHFFDDEEDEDDVGTDDLDQPFDKALAAKQQKALKEPKAQKAPKPAKAPKVKKQRGKDADTLAFTPASSLEMSPLTPRPPRKLVLDGDEEEIDPRIVIERPNAGA